MMKYRDSNVNGKKIVCRTSKSVCIHSKPSITRSYSMPLLPDSGTEAAASSSSRSAAGAALHHGHSSSSGQTLAVQTCGHGARKCFPDLALYAAGVAVATDGGHARIDVPCSPVPV